MDSTARRFARTAVRTGDHGHGVAWRVFEWRKRSWSFARRINPSPEVLASYRKSNVTNSPDARMLFAATPFTDG